MLAFFRFLLVERLSIREWMLASNGNRGWKSRLFKLIGGLGITEIEAIEIALKAQLEL